jgi:GNAT superfamily N-acetyltransferase
VAIRAADATDLDTIFSLINELAEYEQLAHEVVADRATLGAHLFGPDPVASVTLATDDGGTGGTVVGFALWFRTFSTFLGRPGIWLEDLFVRPEARGHGHGAALLRDLRTRTDGRVEWSVLDWNRSAIEFYDRLGARPVDGWTTYRWLPDALPSAADTRGTTG